MLAGGRGRVDLAVRFGILERPGHGPVVIDTGWPERRSGHGIALRLYQFLLRARVDQMASPYVVLSGQQPEAILLSHLHADHLGDLHQFPDVPIYASHNALAVARDHPWRARRHGIVDELLPRTVLDLSGDTHLPFGLGEGLDVLGDGSVFSVPLPGHADGHTGFLFPAFDPPLLYAADVQWMLTAVLENRPPNGPARLVYSDAAAAMESLARVRAFADAGGRVVLCHDPAPVPVFTA